MCEGRGPFPPPGAGRRGGWGHPQASLGSLSSFFKNSFLRCIGGFGVVWGGGAVLFFFLLKPR